MKYQYFLGLSLLTVSATSAFAAPALARVVESRGVTWGGSAGGNVAVGSTIPAGASILTNAAGKATVIPFPAGVVSFAASTRASVLELDLSRKAGNVERVGSFQLDEGTLFFAAEQKAWNHTEYSVVTPRGKVVARQPEDGKTATVGIVEVKNGQLQLVAEAGRFDCVTTSGGTISVSGGAVLTSSGSSFQVLNLATGQVSVYDAVGTQTESRTATATEMSTATGALEIATAETESLIESGAVTASVAEQVRETISSVNQGLASLGLAQVNSTAIGSTAGTSGSGGLPALGGFSGAGAANPANLSGGVRSPEQ